MDSASAQPKSATMATDTCNKKRKIDSDDNKLHKVIDRLRQENAQLRETANKCCDECRDAVYLQDIDRTILERITQTIEIYDAGGGANWLLLLGLRDILWKHSKNVEDLVVVENPFQNSVHFHPKIRIMRPLTLNQKAGTAFGYPNRAPSMTLDQYSKFPLYEYNANDPFIPTDIETTKLRLDDNTVGRLFLLLAAGKVPKTFIKRFDAFTSHGSINPTFLGNGAPCLDSEGQAMWYRPMNTKFGLIPLIGECSTTTIRQGAYVVNDIASVQSMPGFAHYVMSIMEGTKWSYLAPAKAGEVVEYKVMTQGIQATASKKRKADAMDDSQDYEQLQRELNEAKQQNISLQKEICRLHDNAKCEEDMYLCDMDRIVMNVVRDTVRRYKGIRNNEIPRRLKELLSAQINFLDDLLSDENSEDSTPKK
ncbi:hypothetical protein V495_06963 [Pseudogymnoascus sp. VKM F-4514 (FW-929)]|nr:hypothetical protein V495_06963 [Pseudogymnoascus sp. VKM F-4514 (FW-929)]KFY58237.1 hypothetical protein V497_04954 [Pseudogymnoascus sp. VKM F-4516 (FW-969)]